MRRRACLGTLGLMLALAAAAGHATADGRLKVVATFSILGDMVQNVGGEAIALTTLVGPDSDAHVYSPQPHDAMALARADIIFVNGLGFEGWIDRLITSSGTTAPVVVASSGVRARGTAGDHASADPHAWQTIGNAMVYVDNIRDALATTDPANAAHYRARAAAYAARLEALEARARQSLEAVPPTRRKVVTSHDAFGYFEGAYGVEFLAPVGVSTEGEASAADVARLIRQIRAGGITAIFVENVTDPSLVRQIARETGVTIGGRLYSDALSGPTEPAPTYIDMFTHNLEILTRAMGSAPDPGDRPPMAP